MSALAAGWNITLARVRASDRVIVAVVLALLAIGVVLSLASSPAASARFRIDETFYFAARQAAYAGLGVVVMLGAAALESRHVRRAGVVLAGAALLLCLAAVLFGPEVNGAHRWLALGDQRFQPSELLKPGLVIFWAWMLSQATATPGFPGRRLALGALTVAAAILVAQPDIGQAALLAAVCGAMLVMSGLAWRWMIAGLAAAVIAGRVVYEVFPHARERFDAFVNPQSDGAYQVNRALDAIAAGGVFGRGPGEGVIKQTLPDAHADFVFAVAAEEFGWLASLGLIALFGVLAVRGLARAAKAERGFEQMAAGGLITLLTLQAVIHIAVNLSLIPAKGMTLPFISFGGSSMIGAALCVGFCLALLRERPGRSL
jgi:cell division protein FtsW